jgi:hypothetical protein
MVLFLATTPTNGIHAGLIYDFMDCHYNFFHRNMDNGSDPYRPEQEPEQ